METPPRPTTRSRLSARIAPSLLLLASALLASCTDAPVVEPGAGGGGLLIAPSLALRGAVAGTPQADALNEAFDRVDRFRLIIRRQSNNELVKDTVIAVAPGQSAYDLSAPVPSVLANERFVVVIVAMQGQTVLFESDPVTLTAVSADANPADAPSPQVELAYTGPGATAASVVVAPGSLLLSPGGTGALTATVADAGGAVIAGVPLSWSSSDAAVSVAASGQLSAASEGVARVTATTPTGVGASAWVYVASGEIAFVKDGHVWTRDVSGGTATDRSPGAGGASAPTWGPGGGTLAWTDGGQVYLGGSAVTAGSWPSISPDGTKLAVERGGQVWFTNADGSNPTEGPGGTSPAWLDGAYLAVGGGSVQRVRADGSERSTLAGGAAALPAVGPGGRLAYTSGGALGMQGGGTVLTGVSGRAAWSANGRWLLAPAGGDLVLADPNGLAPGFPLGLAGASDPAWRGAAPSGSPSAPSIASLEPDPAVPGGEVRLVGGGFDWIIPANNQVFFPTPDGPIEGEVRGVAEDVLTAFMPVGTGAGVIRVVTPTGEATIPFEPSLGSIRVLVHFPDGTPATGMPVVLRRGGATAAETSTDAEGKATFDVEPGDYGVALTVPYGYQVFSPNPVSVSLGFEVKSVDFEIGVTPVEVRLDPEPPLALEVGGAPVRVRARALDVNKNPITSFRSIRWISSARVQASGSTLEADIRGVRPSAEPGDAAFAIALDGRVFEFQATVTSHIEGTVIEVRPDLVPAAVPGGVAYQTLRLFQGEEEVGKVLTTPDGRYRFGGLFSGAYQIAITPPQGLVASPASRSVTLSNETPSASGQDFVLRAPGNYGPIRPKIMLCGGSNRDVTTLFPDGQDFELAHGCAPDESVQALLLSRSYYYEYGYYAPGPYGVVGGPSMETLRNYLGGGGIVITEYNISHEIWNLVFDTDVGRGARQGACWDNISAVVQLSPGDPFWSDNSFQPIPTNETGCGYSVSHYPGITPLLGWSASYASLGYRDYGAGRLWAADFDWQDDENLSGDYFVHEAYTELLMGYMMLHRGNGEAPTAPPVALAPIAPPLRPAGPDRTPGSEESSLAVRGRP